MSAPQPALPTGFDDLAPFLDWGLERESDRIRKKVTSSYEEILRFRDAIFPRAAAAVAYLNEKEIRALSPQDRRLMAMLLSLAEVASAIEFYQAPFSQDAWHPLNVAVGEDFPLRPPL